MGAGPSTAAKQPTVTAITISETPALSEVSDKDPIGPIAVPVTNPRSSSQGLVPSAVQSNNNSSPKSTPPKALTSSPANKPAATQKKGVERLVKELQSIVTSPQYATCGYTVKTVGDNIMKWHVELRDFEGQLGTDLQLYQKATSRDHVLMEITFPPDYPAQPPFMRICYPRFHQYTGHITIGGSICVHDLTRSGWNPANELSVFLIMVRHLLQAGGALINMDNLSEYHEGEAREAYNRVARQHGWKP